MKWADLRLGPGDRLLDQRNRDLWWLVVGSNEKKAVICYTSPTHLESHMGGHTGTISLDDEVVSGYYRIRRRDGTIEETR